MESVSPITSLKTNLDIAHKNLDQETQKNAILSEVNSQLKQQLSLTSAELEKSKKELKKERELRHKCSREFEEKEAEWNEEKKALSTYLGREQNRLISIWHLFGTFKKQYNEMTSLVKSNLLLVKREINDVIRNTSDSVRCLVDSDKGNEGVVGMTEQQLKELLQVEMLALQKQFDIQRLELTSRISEFESANERLRSEVAAKEENFRNLKADRLNSNVDIPSRSHDVERIESNLKEMESIHDAIRSLAREVIDDSEFPLSKDHRSRTPARHHVTPSTPAENPQNNPRPSSRSPDSKGSTLAMIQAAFQKRRQQILELTEQLRLEKETQSKKIMESLDERKKLEQMVANLKLDLNNSVRLQQVAEAEQKRALKSLDAAVSSRNQMENAHKKLMADLDEEVQSKNERLTTANAEFHRQRSELLTTKNVLEKELERCKEENARCQKLLNRNEVQLSGQTKDCGQLRGTICQLQKEKEAIDRNRSELVVSVQEMKTRLRDVEQQTRRLKEESDAANEALRSSVQQLQSINDGLVEDKIKFSKIVSKLEEDKTLLAEEKISLLNIISGLKEELIRLESVRIDAETEKSALREEFQRSEKQRWHIDENFSAISRELSQLKDRLSSVMHEKELFIQELKKAHQDLEVQSKLVLKLKTEKEEMTHRHADMETKLESSSRDSYRLVQTLEQVNKDHDDLEERFHETQGHIMDLEERNRQMEQDGKDLKDKRKQLEVEVNRLNMELENALEEAEHWKRSLEQRRLQAETEVQLALRQQKAIFDSDIERLMQEKELQRLEFDSKHVNLRRLHEDEMEEMKKMLLEKNDTLERELSTVQANMEEELQEAKSFHHQMLIDAENEKQMLMSNLTKCEHEMKNQSENMEKMQKEFFNERERDRQLISEHQSELNRLRSNHQSIVLANEMIINETKEQLSETYRQRESVRLEAAELKAQLKMTEETRDAFGRDLADMRRTLREADDAQERLVEEAKRLRRSISEEADEREQTRKSFADLRAEAIRMEEEKIELSRLLEDFRRKNTQLDEENISLQRELTEFRANLRDVEQARMEAKKEVQDLRRIINTVEGEQKHRQEQAEKETLKWKQAENDFRLENNRLKELLVDSQKRYDLAKAELARCDLHSRNLREEYQLKEKQLQATLTELRLREKSLEDRCRSLERTLDGANANVGDLRMKLNAYEGRVQGLEGRLAQTDEAKKVAEFRLCSIISGVKRVIAGHQGRDEKYKRHTRENSFSFKEESSVDGVPHQSPSPGATVALRRMSPIARERSPSPTRTITADIDPEEILHMIRRISEELVSVQRQRDNLAASAASLEASLNDSKQLQSRNESELKELRAKLKAIYEDKQDLECRLAKSQTTLLIQQQTIDGSDRERKHLIDRMNSVEQSLSVAELRNKELQKKTEKMKQDEGALDEGNRMLRRQLDDVEKKLKNAEAAKRSDDAEMEKLRVILEDREGEIQSLHDQLSRAAAKNENTEAMIADLQLTVDRLNSLLTKAAEEHRDQVQQTESLREAASNQKINLSNLQERTKHLEKALTTSEQDVRLINDRLVVTRTSLNEEKERSEKLMAKIQKLQFELNRAETTRSDLQHTLKQRHSTEQDLTHRLERLLREKESLSDELTQQQRSILNHKTTRQESERTKNALEKTILKVEQEKIEAEERLSKATAELHAMEQKLRSLQEDNCHLCSSLMSRASKEKDSTFLNVYEMENENLEAALLHTQQMQQMMDRKRRGSGCQKRIKHEEQLMGGEMLTDSTTSSNGRLAFPQSNVHRLITQMNDLNAGLLIKDHSALAMATKDNCAIRSPAYSPASRLRPNAYID